MSEKECIECGATETPQWREINGQNYCNACGIRLSRSKNRQKETLENKMSTAIEDMKIDGDYAKEIVLLKTRMKRIQGSLEKKSVPVCKCRPARLQGTVRKLRDKVNRISKRVYVAHADDLDKLTESIQKLERTQLEIVKEMRCIPNDAKPERTKKEQILELMHEGFTATQISAQIGANIQYVQNIIRTERRKEQQIWANTPENTASERPSKKENSGYTVGKDLVKSLAEMFFKNLADRMIITEKKEENKNDD